MEQDYIAVDLETTGLNAKTDKIIEVGAVRVIGGREISHYHSLVNPRRKLESRIVELTGITDQMVRDAPDFGDILGEFRDFCGNLPLLGHHIMFDYSFLKRAMVNRGTEFEKKGIDTLTLCRLLMPEAEAKSLEAACSYFGIAREQAHRALGDARDAHHLYQRLTQMPEKNQRARGAFDAKPMIYRVKKEQPASKKQKEDLRYLLKYHKIDVPVEIEFLSRNEVSRLKDNIISQYGRIGTRD
ncbi:MAG: 3'-5' exonuclease [Lachnospiraceae bacterium]|nr:3'-5' exonuclease [Lachnospiraceae bacterium]